MQREEKEKKVASPLDSYTVLLLACGKEVFVGLPSMYVFSVK
jgi:hypothetical protein